MSEQKTSTKGKLLEVAKQLMTKQGYNATSIEEICNLAKVTKGGFFYYFETKEDLGLNVLNDYWRSRQRQFADTDWMKAAHPLKQLEAFLKMIADVFMHDPNGSACLAGSFTQELSATHPKFRRLLAEIFAEWAQEIKPMLENAKVLAPSPQQIDVDLLADYIIAVIEGALILALARQNLIIIGQHLSQLNSHLVTQFST